MIEEMFQYKKRSRKEIVILDLSEIFSLF